MSIPDSLSTTYFLRPPKRLWSGSKGVGVGGEGGRKIEMAVSASAVLFYHGTVGKILIRIVMLIILISPSSLTKWIQGLA